MAEQWSMPAGFIWGAATASYQIEGAAREDGRGESIWDRFSHTPGKVTNGDTGDIACDSYHRTAEDLAVMRELGLQAYRFSVAWPRVIPAGTGAGNAAGLDYYERLVDTLLGAGIIPFVTLYHWDLPQALQDRGGWDSRATVDAFVAFADAVSRRLGDRVGHWITHNEPWVMAHLGHRLGLHAPGLTDTRVALQVAHHLLLSHGAAVPVLRANSPGAKVGITLNLNHVDPASEGEADRAAAARGDVMMNRWFLDPIFRGAYPAEVPAAWAGLLPRTEPGDLAAISAPIDFLGVNNYFRSLVAAGPSGDGSDDLQVQPPGAELTDMPWEVSPDAFYQLLTRLHRDYPVRELYVTENGASYADVVGHDGQVRDDRRVSYLQRHLRAAHRAITEGTPLKGYFAWSLLDNFEWAYGYSRRFGITYVDWETQRRIVKGSGRWYARAIAANGPVD